MTAQERREQILTAVRPAVLERGISITTRELAAAAAVAEGTLFRTFSDKEELLSAVLTKELHECLCIDGIGERFETIEALIDEALEVLIDRFARLFRISMVLGSLVRNDDPEMLSLYVRLRDDLATRFEPFASQLRVSTGAATEFLITMCSMAGSNWGQFQRGRSRATREEIRTMLLHGIVTGPDALSPLPDVPLHPLQL